jgi:CBS domain-containing protein/gamma-glutamyl:cysteine ligase YbdK (ATP-grasp superfamily)
MGEQNVGALDQAALRDFTRALLDDVQALERMIDAGMIETGIQRIGAEQEFFIVDGSWRPAGLAAEMLERLDPKIFTTELATFNIEANLTPRAFRAGSLLAMEGELEACVASARRVAHDLGGDVVLAGILPTLTEEHISLDWMTPNPRYHELNEVLCGLSGGEFHTLIKGVDQLQTTCDNVMLEACNTSFQIHFQVAPEEFARLYNLAQAVTAPVLAAAVNSPVLLQHRLWHETRVALFQQSLDSRSASQKKRGTRTRVQFGDSWVKDGVLEIYREDIARFRSILGGDVGESSLELLDRGEVPPLKALCIHNGTVYRWNRACYGVGGGKPHLRIEARALPAGPTPLDEMANAAFLFGLMAGIEKHHGDVTQVLLFDHVKENFVNAARYGLKAQFHWVDGEVIAAKDLILDRLLPQAADGLAEVGFSDEEIERYISVLERRVGSQRTGSQWVLDSLEAMGTSGTQDARSRALVHAMVRHQHTGDPVHSWAPVMSAECGDWRDDYRTVSQIMVRDLFTVHPDDLVDLAASLMDWEHLRHVPVEDAEGNLVGLVTNRRLMRLLGRGSNESRHVAVADIMLTDPVTVRPDTSVIEAVRLMRQHGVAGLPVATDGKLEGLVTEGDFLEVAAKLFEEQFNAGCGGLRPGR